MAVKREAIRRVLSLWGSTAAICKRRNDDLEAFISLKEQAYDTLKSMRLDGMPKAVGALGDPTSKAALDIGGIIEQYDRAISSITKEIREALDRKIAVDSLVKEFAPEEQKILEYRYVLGLNWKMICERAGYAENHARDIERNIVEKLSSDILIV